MRVAVLLPCYNEEKAIGETVKGFAAALPGAEIYVYDNASTDKTSEVAAKAGAIVKHEALKGKGNVVRRMFADIDADIYLLADGDATYDPKSAPALIDALTEKDLDMVVGTRSVESGDPDLPKEAYRLGHQTGNRVLTGLVTSIFGRRFTDILSGYRAMSRRFVKSFPMESKGFEIETELTVHALEIRVPVEEISTPYGARKEGSESKLNTFRDGFRILRLIINLVREERPMSFFGGLAGLCLLAMAGFGAPILFEYFRSGLVPRQPTWVLSIGLALAALHLFSVGLILDTVTRGRREAKRLAYLALS